MIRINRLISVMVIITVYTTFVIAQNLTVEGVALCKIGSRISLFDLQTEEEAILVKKSDITGSFANLHEPSFSPDGKKICFILAKGVSPTIYTIYTADNDGDNSTSICEINDKQPLNWCTDGYIYWCENTNAIYRVNVVTKQKETYWDQPDIHGYGYDKNGPKIEDMIVSNDGKFASARGGGKVSVFNLQEKYLVNYGKGGCSGWISPDGDLVAHPYTCCVPFPEGASSYNTVTAIENIPDTRDSTLIRPVERFLWPPGQPNGPETARSGWFRWAKNNNNYVIGKAMGSNGSLGKLLYDVRTGEWKSLLTNDHYARSMWIGTLPEPPEDGPTIAISPLSVLLTETTLSVDITISNTGTGTLGTIDITETAQWLETTMAGSGNTQTLSVTADPSGLEDGTYRTTVTASGGGATNSENVNVTFNVGVYLTAPGNVKAAVTDEKDVMVQWADNTDREDGYAIERSTDGNAFSEIGRVATDVVSYTDTSLSAGTYYYRVRAFDASSYSSYSDTAQTTIETSSSITITNPTGGETFEVGEEVAITWTAQNLSAVKLELSTNGGRTWESLTTDAGIFTTDDNWGNYSWTAPDITTSEAKIRIRDYNQGSASDETEMFSIGTSSIVGRTLSSKQHAPAVRLVSYVNGSLRFKVHLGNTGNHTAQLLLNTLDGRVLTRKTLHSSGTVNFGCGVVSGNIVLVATLIRDDGRVLVQRRMAMVR